MMHLEFDTDVSNNHLFQENGFSDGQSVRNVLVTGGAGFIGGWFIRRMLEVHGGKYQIVCLDNLDYCASLKNFSAVNTMKNFRFIEGDVCIPHDVERTLVEYDIDAVVHFAARSHVDQSFVDPLSFTATNVIGTQVLLEACRRFGAIKRFIYVSTDEVYGENNQAAGFREDQYLRPTNPYSASKAAAEMVVHAYQMSFDIPIIITRCNNVFGPYQFPDKVIPKFIALLQKGHKMTIHGDGQSARSFLYAGDAAEALDVIFHRGKDGETYNIASQNLLHVREVAQKIFDALGMHPTDALEKWIEEIEDRPFNDRLYWTDDSKLRALGWRERTAFDVALDLTITWYRHNGDEFWS